MRTGLGVTSAATVVVDARAAEADGFDLVAGGEHLFFHGPTANSVALLAAAAGATERIRLLSSVALLPLYPAPLLAKLAATLDQVSGGRYDLGVGAGGEFPREFAAAGVDPASRFRRLDEGLMVLRALFAGGPVRLDGEFTTLDDVALDPPPVQPGGPPLWLGGRRSGALRRAARFADVWLPYMVDPTQVRDGLARIAEQAAGYGRPADAVRGALFVWTCVDADGAWARRTGVDAVSATYAQDFTRLADRYLLCGDVDTVVARLAEFAAAGVETVVLQIAAGDDAGRARVRRTLADEVLPRLRDI